MMAFQGMLIGPAEQAGMKVPPDPDNTPYKSEDYPHFWVFCQLQLGRPIMWNEPWENAKIIAAIPVEKLKKMNLGDFLALGLRWQQ